MTQSEAFRRVERLLSAARAVADAGTPAGNSLRERLQVTTGLSPAGIELGFASLELNPSEAELTLLLGAVKRTARRVWVLLSGNVFTASHRAIALALAASPNVFVRPSRRDPALAEALHQMAPKLFDIVSEIQAEPGDSLHVYGSDETIAAVKATLPAGVDVWAHGFGFGAGIVFSEARDQDLAQEFARDVILFDQAGCLSPRVIVLGEAVDSARFASALAERLREWRRRVPQAGLSADECAEQAWFERVARSCGSVYEAGGGFVVAQRAAAHLLIPPALGNVVIVSSREPLAQLKPLAGELTCIAVACTQGGSAPADEAGSAPADAEALVQANFPHARLCSPGRMQQPRFDGPVDRRP